MVRVKCGVKRLFMKPKEDKQAAKDDHWIIAGEQFNFDFGSWEESTQHQWKKPRLEDDTDSRVETGNAPSQPQLNRIGRFQAPTPSCISTFTATSVGSSNPGLTSARGEHVELPPPARADKPTLLVMRGDPTDWSPEAIVNDTDGWLLHQRGLGATIVRKGGPEIRRQSDEWVHYQGEVKVGSAMWTTAGNLPSRFVIHTVGPDVSYRWLTQQQQLELRQTVRSALAVADELEVTSVAIPAISTGPGRCYPRRLAAREIVAECLQYCDDCPDTTLRLIVLMNEDELTTSIFAKALKEERQRRQLQRQRCKLSVVPKQPARVKGDDTLFDGGNDYLSTLLQKLKQTDAEEKDIATAAASRLATLKKWAL